MRLLSSGFWVTSRILAALLLVLVLLPLSEKLSVASAENIAASEEATKNSASNKDKYGDAKSDKVISDQPAASDHPAVPDQPAAADKSAAAAAQTSDAKTPTKQPLQGYAKQDSKGTPAIPEWKLKSGYDEVLGIFYVGLLGFKLHAVNGPMGEAVLGKSKLEHWKGHKPHPCLLKFTKMTDETGGYYFRTIGSEDGPRGWILPQPAEPHKPREWAIYYMQ
jgi:hypothetical protein